MTVRGRLAAFAGAVDRVNRAVGRAVSWLVLAMVLVGSYNALVRWLGRYVGLKLASNAYIELQWYLFSVVFLLGAAYALREDAHVRVDVFYGRLGERARAWIDLAGALLLVVPFAVAAIALAWPSVRNSWAVLETSPDPGGLPRYPLKSVIPLSFALLALQGLALAIRRALFLASGERR